MKKLYNVFYPVVLLLMLLLACNDEEAVENTIINDPLEITASVEEVVTDMLDSSGEAVKFTWTTGTDYGTGFAIVYTFELDLQGGNFTNGITLEMGRNIYEKSYTHKELNEIITAQFSAVPFEEAIYEYRVSAQLTAGDFETQISPVKTIKITPYEPITESLFLAGSAIPEGINPSFAPIAGFPRIFRWEGELVPGEFFLTTALGSVLPSYYKGEKEGSLYLREDENDPHTTPFTVIAKNNYTVYADLLRMTLMIEEETPTYTNLWITAAGTGWTLVPMTVDPEDKFIFYYTGQLSAPGGLKIMTKSNWTGVVLRPPGDGYKNGVNLDVIERPESWQDDKWDVRFSVSTCHIVLNLRTMKMDIVKKNNTISLVGDASPGGWTTNVENMTPSEDGNTFTWTGAMTPGVFRLSCNGQWGEEMYFPEDHDLVPTGAEEPVYAYRPDGKDTNWKIEEAGTYTIILNQLKETIIIRKQ